jgi:hypothetical protein
MICNANWCGIWGMTDLEMTGSLTVAVRKEACSRAEKLEELLK